MGSGNPGKSPTILSFFVPAWRVIFMLLWVYLILANKCLLLNTLIVLQLSSRIQLAGMVFGPVCRMCPFGVPLRDR